MSLIGYARVSTAEGRQVLDRQLDALNEAGCERVFEDRASGAASDRPKLAACLDHLRQSDVLVVLDLDRLGRRAGELIALIDELDRRGVGFRALNSPMDTTTPAGRAFMQIQAAFAEMERNVMRQRIREGVKAARARGRKGGRPRVMTHEKLRYAQNLMADRTRSIPDICRHRHLLEHRPAGRSGRSAKTCRPGRGPRVPATHLAPRLGPHPAHRRIQMAKTLNCP